MIFNFVQPIIFDGPDPYTVNDMYFHMVLWNVDPHVICLYMISGDVEEFYCRMMKHMNFTTQNYQLCLSSLELLLGTLLQHRGHNEITEGENDENVTTVHANECDCLSEQNDISGGQRPNHEGIDQSCYHSR